MKMRILYLFFVAALLGVSASAQIMSNGTGGGDWNTGTTWIGGVAPIATDNVVIQSGDSVTVSAASSCALLTMNPTSKLTISGAFALPGTAWNLDLSSTVYFTAVPSAWMNATFGNLVYSGANYSLTQNLSVLGNLTVTTATLRGNGATSGALTHTIAGNVTIGPGTSARISGVTQTSATTASCTWNIGGNVSLTSANSGNRIILYESAGPHSGSAIFSINGNLSVSTGSRLEFKSSSSTSADYPLGVINLKGNLTMDGNWNISTATAGVSPGFEFNFVGTNPQTWSGVPTVSVSGFILNININNAAGVTLTAPQTISNSRIALNLVGGTLTTTTTNLLTIGTSGTLAGGNATSFVNGPLAHTIGTTSSTARIFPIGKGSAYRPLTLTVTQDAATATIYTAEAFNAAPTSRTFPMTIDRVSAVRYYTIAKGTGANVTNASVTLSYDADDVVNDPTTLRVAKDDGAGAWVDLGGTGSAPTTGTITSATNFTTFSDFVLANNTGGGNLPVQLASFTAVRHSNGNVRLDWLTVSEINNYGFEVQRSFGSVGGYVSISGLIAGHGTTNQQHAYSFTDNNAPAVEAFYRLKQIDLDGSVHFTEPVRASSPTDVAETVPAQFVLKQNYPNPFNPATTIAFSVATTARATLELFNTLGQKVFTLFDGVAEVGRLYTVQLDGRPLTSGMYFYRLQSGASSDLKKLILLK